jgi:hypothetical protein
MKTTIEISDALADRDFSRFSELAATNPLVS